MVAAPSNRNIEAAKEAVSPWYWAIRNELLLQGGQFGAKGHAYLWDIMDCDHPFQVGKKGAQMGLTEGPGVIRTLHGMIYGRYPHGTLYLFPTHDDVTDFSKSRFNPLIDQNAVIRDHVQDTDAAHIKKIGSGMLYLRGARAQKRIGALKRTSSRLKTVAVDRLVLDERDEMDDDMVSLAMERMSHSDVRETFCLSTPSIPDFGVDKLFAKSDQRVWMIPCMACGTETCLEIEFLEDPERVVRRDPDTGKGIRVCKKCGAKIRPSRGHWVALYPNVKDTVGWWISQLNSIYWDPMQIREMYEDPPDGDLTEVMNSKLGMAYIAAENELTIQQVLSCCGNQGMRELEEQAIKHLWPMCYGLDVQKNHLVMVLGTPTSEKTRKVVKVAKVPSWNDVHDIATKFNMRCAVIDLEPETHRAREFQVAEPYKIWLCDYAENQKVAMRENDEAGLVVVKRTEFLDRSHNLVFERRVELPRRSVEIDDFAKQCCSAVKILKEDEETGSKKYLYIRRDRDDYRHALSYFELACQDSCVGGYAHSVLKASNQDIKDAYEGNDPLERTKVTGGQFQESYDPRFG